MKRVFNQTLSPTETLSESRDIKEHVGVRQYIDSSLMSMGGIDTTETGH